MKIHNLLPQFLFALEQWERKPGENEFSVFMKPLYPLLRPMLEDFGLRFPQGLYGVVEGLNWDLYRKAAMRLDPEHEERRLRAHIKAVERLLGTALRGESILFGAFTLMDGYARFDRGTHQVFLGVDESHGRGRYLDVLITHELTHVAREPLPEIWADFGLSPLMSHDAFVTDLPVIEHLAGEGLSCVVSELLNPDEDPWHYAYQTEDALEQILEHGPAIDKVVHAEIRNEEGEYRRLYDPALYMPEMPRYAHYVWAWLFARHLLKTTAEGDPRKLLHLCSKQFIDQALEFKLPRSL